MDIRLGAAFPIGPMPSPDAMKMRKWEGPPKKIREGKRATKPPITVTDASRDAEDEIREMLRKPGCSYDIKKTLDFQIDEARRENYKRYIAGLPRQECKPPM